MASSNLVLQGQAVEELHDHEGPDHRARRCRVWCRCWDGSMRKRLAPRAESAAAFELVLHAPNSGANV